MKIGPIAHGVLLVAALGLAYKSWTRETPKETKVGTYVVWNEDPASFTGLSFDSESKSVRLERKGSGKDAYLWATVTRTSKKSAPKPATPAKPTEPATPGAAPAKPGDAAAPAAPAAPAPAATPAKPTEPATPGPAKASDEDPHDHGAPGESPDEAEPAGPGDPAAAADPVGPGDPAPEAEKVRTEKQFPVGEDGEALVANFAQLRALRSLGVLGEDKKTEYGLADSTESLTVSFGSTHHELVVGARVFGGSDRYVIDPTSGKAYVISTEIMKPLDGGESSLMLKKLHAYEDDAVAKLEIDTSFGKKALVKKVIEDDKGKQTGWALADKPDAPDQTLTNFISQLDKLKPTEYQPTLELSSLEKILTVSYAGPGGALGRFGLYKKLPTEPGKTSADYFIDTELTRVPAKVSTAVAERLEHNDLPQLFGQPAKPMPEKPVKPTDGPPASLVRPDSNGATPLKNGKIAPIKSSSPPGMMTGPH